MHFCNDPSSYKLPSDWRKLFSLIYFLLFDANLDHVGNKFDCHSGWFNNSNPTKEIARGSWNLLEGKVVKIADFQIDMRNFFFSRHFVVLFLFRL